MIFRGLQHFIFHYEQTTLFNSGHSFVSNNNKTKLKKTFYFSNRKITNANKGF